MDVTGTDPRTRTGFFLWPWAGYPNMASTSSANAQGTPPLGLSSHASGPSFEQGLQIHHHQQQQQQQQAQQPGHQQDNSLESFYSRLPYSAGAVPSLQQMQQHQRQQREAAAAAAVAAVAVSEMQGQNQQQSSGRMSGLGAVSQAPPQHPPVPPPPQFDHRTALMNGRQQPQQSINSASSSPLNSSAYHNPSLSPNSQQQQQQVHQFQRHYSSTGSLHNTAGGGIGLSGSSASPLDGRISSSASPSGNSAATTYCLKRPPNEFNSATAMALALQAVAKGDRQMPPPPPPHPSSMSISSSSATNTPAVDHLQGGGDVFSSTNYLFQPSVSKGHGGVHGRSSTEAAAMAAAMAAQAASEMGMDPRGSGAHALSGLHAAGGFLPDFLSSSSAMGDTKLEPSGSVGFRPGPFDGPPTMGGGIGMMDGLQGIYGHATKGYKCKICQHVS